MNEGMHREVSFASLLWLTQLTSYARYVLWHGFWDPTSLFVMLSFRGPRD